MEKVAGEIQPTTIVPYLIEQSTRFTLPLKNTKTNWVLQGYSKAGERTGFWLEPINILLDAGVVTNKYPTSVFITHSHVDHSWNLPWIYGCRTPKLKGHETLPGRPVYAPSSAWPMLAQLERACQNLSHGNMGSEELKDTDIFQAQRTYPSIVKAGKIINDLPGLNGIQLETLHCYHPAECVGYGFSTVTQKLKKEYQSLPSKEIAELRKNNHPINELQILPQFAFFGDTNIKALLEHEEWKKYPIITIECTVYPSIKKSPEEVSDIGHIHWDSIWPFIRNYPDIFFVLIHSSQALTSQYLENFEEKIKTENPEVQNFKIWV